MTIQSFQTEPFHQLTNFEMSIWDEPVEFKNWSVEDPPCVKYWERTAPIAELNPADSEDVLPEDWVLTKPDEENKDGGVELAAERA